MSDKPGISSIFVGVTMNRTEAILVVVSGGCIFFLFLYKGKEKKENPTKIFLLTLDAFDRKNRKDNLKKKNTSITSLYTTQKGPNKNSYFQNSSRLSQKVHY